MATVGITILYGEDTTFPHHKHVGEIILESNEVEIEDILREVEIMIKDDI